MFYPLYGKNSITTKMELYNTVLRTGSDSWTGSGLGKLSVSFKQKNNRNVRSELVLNGTSDPATGDLSLFISKAYIKFKFPGFRAVIGKAPFSWGEGLVFNAGDILFGSDAVTTNLMQSEFQDSTTWMTSLNVPLGPFSFAEGIYLPPNILSAGLDASKEGGRLVTKLAGIKLETGFLYDGTDTTQKVYVTLQGNLVINWHFSAAAFFPKGDPFPNAVKNSFVITGGIYSINRIGYAGTLNWRLETMVKPWQEWKQHILASAGENYGIYVYPEIKYAFNSGMVLLLRSMISPIDSSAVIIPGFSWNVFQGFTVITLISFGTGSPGSTFAWKPEFTGKSGLSLMAGVSVVY